MNLSTKQKELQMQKTNLWLLGVRGGGGINWEIGMDIYTLLYIKETTSKDLLYSTGNSTQYSVMAFRGKESKKVYICITDSLCCTPETNTTL